MLTCAFVVDRGFCKCSTGPCWPCSLIVCIVLLTCSVYCFDENVYFGICYVAGSSGAMAVKAMVRCYCLWDCCGLDLYACVFPPPPVDSNLALMIVWRLRGKLIKTSLCCIVYDSCAHTHVSSSY